LTLIVSEIFTPSSMAAVTFGLLAVRLLKIRAANGFNKYLE